VLGAAACDPSPTPSPPANAPARQLLDMLNDYRADNGRAPLTSVADANAKAQAHAEAMAAQHKLFHSDLPAGIAPGWHSLGENVGMAGSVAAVHLAFAASTPHRTNMLNADFNQVGVGVAYSSDGMVWATEVFVGR
jgi:uncharacterized protein YkwD